METLFAISALLNIVLAWAVIVTISENSKLKEALRNIKKNADSALNVKTPKKASPPPDSRKGIEWKIKR